MSERKIVSSTSAVTNEILERRARGAWDHLRDFEETRRRDEHARMTRIQRFDELQGRGALSVFGVITCHTGLSFPHLKTADGEVIGPDEPKNFRNGILMPQPVESARWRAFIPEPEIITEPEERRGQLSPDLVVKITPTDAYDDLSRDVTISHKGEVLEVQKGGEIVYQGVFSYAPSRFESISDVLEAAFQRPASPGDIAHQSFMNKYGKPATS